MTIPPGTSAARLKVTFTMPVAGVTFAACETTVPVVREPAAAAL
jgi:hypothetical protein